MYTKIGETSVVELEVEPDKDNNPVLLEVAGGTEEDRRCFESEWHELGPGFFLTDEKEKRVRAGEKVILRGRLRFWQVSSLDYGIDYDMDFEESN